MEATVKVVLETKRKNTLGHHAVKLRVTYNRKRKYYSILSLLINNKWSTCSSKKEFESILNAKKGFKKDLRKNYEAIEKKAEVVINEIPFFSFTQFEEKFFNKVTNWDYIGNALEEHISTLRKEERLGYATSFNSTLTVIKYFCEGKSFDQSKIQKKEHKDYNRYKSLMFVDVTPHWLMKFERFLRDNNKSTSTIGIYARNIRVLFNIARKEHGIKAEYPFDRYSPKSSSSYKRALTMEQIKQIANYPALDGTNEQFAKDMFIFSFLANGMNMADIFRLKHKNVLSNSIEFIRYKTKNKEKEIKISVALTDGLKKIISRHSGLSINPETHLFSILDDSMDESTKYRIITQKTKVINSHLKSVAKELKFDEELATSISTYFARHSYATISRNNGESMAYIQESLGHTTLTTTEKYLGSFDEEKRAKSSNKLSEGINIA